MALSIIDYCLVSKERTSIRKEIAELFISEKPGTGIGEDCSKYHYIVENYDNYCIVLKRPTGLNKGFDFTVNIDGMYFKRNRRYQNPSHNDIIEGLKYVKQNYNNYNFVKDTINKIFLCKSVNFDSLKDMSFIDGEGVERPIALLLLAVKWLFIEQDITYWNWSGRYMLLNKLKEEGLA